ncbi:MAG TPA: OmpA family protein [Candidatus Acidoferrum sp.]|nr:OmpA family protein [Candidatus Acidoferrum sp.]
MTNLTYLLTFAVALTLAATGCKNHRTVGVTPIKGAPTGNPSDTDISTKPYTGDTGSPQIAAAPLDTFEGMVRDTSALAAYTIHFAYDSAAIRKSDKSNLQAVADALSRDRSAKLLIEGNCDERGTEEYNRALGERRAQAARQALAKLGVDPMRIRTISYGKDKPADPGHDEAAWSKNRRDDFVLLHPKSGA